MPTIAFVSPKGGVGKTTSAFLFSTAIAAIFDITLIDADPNHPIKTWAEGGNTPERMTIVSDADEDTIIERMEDAASQTAFVVVDLEGTASMTVMKALLSGGFRRHPDAGLTAGCQRSKPRDPCRHAGPENDGQGDPLCGAADAHAAVHSHARPRAYPERPY